MPNGMYGSSPRVRGTRYFPCANKQPSRFIPACAGNTEPSAPYSVDVPVHPRVCGEHTSRADTEALKAGSSPRVRGTRLSSLRAWAAGRFIPACAGNTLTPNILLPLSSVHPRVCGEHAGRAGCSIRTVGSSPRVRGTPVYRCGYAEIRRFIPACAGNTPAASPASNALPVHPRVCGEHAGCSVRTVIRAGSSPRVRGTLCRSHGCASGRRFIPACAGNTICGA